MLSLTFTAWVYNEPIVWGIALALVFQSCLIRQLEEPTRLRWWLMGMLAGATFSVRPTAAVAMTLGLLASLAMPNSERASHSGNQRATFLISMVRRGLWVGFGFLPLFCIAISVNWLRWGDPWTFVPPAAHIQVMEDARRLDIALTQGTFSLVRLPLGIGYYLFGLLTDSWTSKMAERFSDGLGWPRSALLLTSTTQIVMAGMACIGIGSRAWATVPKAKLGWSILVAPVALGGMMLTFIYMNYRYRFEFLPLLVLCCIMGAATISTMKQWHARLCIAGLAVMLFGNIVISHLDLLQAKLASFAQPEAARERIIRLTPPISGLFVRESPQ